MRMQVRIKRLQDMYKSLGRDPNLKGKSIFVKTLFFKLVIICETFLDFSFSFNSEYEIKGLVADFDKVARKTIAKIKKGKNE